MNTKESMINFILENSKEYKKTQLTKLKVDEVKEIYDSLVNINEIEKSIENMKNEIQPLEETSDEIQPLEEINDEIQPLDEIQSSMYELDNFESNIIDDLDDDEFYIDEDDIFNGIKEIKIERRIDQRFFKKTGRFK